VVHHDLAMTGLSSSPTLPSQIQMGLATELITKNTIYSNFETGEIGIQNSGKIP
jgi:hypothetical protein